MLLPRSTLLKVSALLQLAVQAEYSSYMLQYTSLSVVVVLLVVLLVLLNTP